MDSRISELPVEVKVIRNADRIVTPVKDQALSK
jgi:hypothetical protein